MSIHFELVTGQVFVSRQAKNIPTSKFMGRTGSFMDKDRSRTMSTSGGRRSRGAWTSPQTPTAASASKQPPLLQDEAGPSAGIECAGLPPVPWDGAAPASLPSPGLLPAPPSALGSLPLGGW